MGSATRQAGKKVIEALHGQHAYAGVVQAKELFLLCNVVEKHSSLQRALGNVNASLEAKMTLISSTCSGLSEQTMQLIRQIFTYTWSNIADGIDMIEELGIRILAGNQTDGFVLDELFSFSRLVSVEPTIELGLRNKFASDAAREELVLDLVQNMFSANTVLILRQVCAHLRGRNPRTALERALIAVAGQQNKMLAFVTCASAMQQHQIVRLNAILSKTYGCEVAMHIVLEPEMLGGLRVQIGNDVIDGTVAARIQDIRLQLAG